MPAVTRQPPPGPRRAAISAAPASCASRPRGGESTGGHRGPPRLVQVVNRATRAIGQVQSSQKLLYRRGPGRGFGEA